MPGLDKGKAPAVPLPCPAAGSADPSTSFGSLWAYIQPALDHLVRAPLLDGAPAGVLSSEYHVLIHTATYNYVLGQTKQPPPVAAAAARAPTGHDLYARLDAYFAAAARDALHAAPPAEDGPALAAYAADRYARFAAGAQAVHRLLNYMNRHFVQRAVDEDRGWLRVADVVDAGASGDLRRLQAHEKEQLVARVRARRKAELEKWGLPADGGTPEQTAAAEASAEAASVADRIVPVASMALRRFRTDLVEPLLAVPKSKGNKRRPAPPPSTPGPKGRLARSVKALLESKTADKEETRRVALILANCFARIGVRPNHPLRQRLQSYLDKTS
jgi:hypothetical protein